MYCVVIFVASKICDFGVTYTSKIVAEIVVISSCIPTIQIILKSISHCT